jgi:hypothetical protein
MTGPARPHRERRYREAKTFVAARVISAGGSVHPAMQQAPDGRTNSRGRGPGRRDRVLARSKLVPKGRRVEVLRE